MRIGIDARMLNKAGIRRYATELVQNLSKIDQQNQYIVYLSSQARPDDIKTLNPSFNLVHLGAPLFSIREQFLLIAQLKKDKLDLLHTTFDFGVPLLPPSNVIVTVHDAFFGSATFFRSYKTRLFYQLLTRYSVFRSSRILVISHFVKKKLLKHLPKMYRKADKIRVVPNGVSPQFYQTTHVKKSTRIKRKYDIHDKYLLCVGSFASRNKNLRRILEAFRLMSTELVGKYQLVIVGEMSDRVPEALNLIEELKLRNRVLCLGYIPDEDLPLLYSNAEVFIFPSLHEGFGLPILEAMACGTPVITSNTTAMPEIAQDAAILVNPYHAGEISSNIIKILTNARLREELSKKGWKRAKDFSWLITARRTLDVYEEVVKQNPR